VALIRSHDGIAHNVSQARRHPGLSDRSKWASLTILSNRSKLKWDDMTGTAAQPVRPAIHAGSVMARWIVTGAVIGTVAGGIAATIDFPIAGTFFGAFAGLAVGVVAGATNGLVAIVARLVGARWAPTVGCGLVTLAAGAADVGLAHRHAMTSWLVIGGIALIVAALARVTTYGVEAVDLGRRLGRRSAGEVLARAAIGGAAVGGVLGAVAGLVIGVVTDPVYLIAFAVIEGGILCAVSGVVVALLLAVLLLAPRVRVRP
jgi:hypothetical protein